MTATTSTNGKPIPTFSSAKEEAAYWDSHSVAEHWESAAPIRLRVSKKLSEGVTIRFDPETL